MIDITTLEEIKRSFSPILQKGTSLPNVKSVVDGTVFFKKESDRTYVEHIMIDGKWHKKVVDNLSQVILEEV